MRYGATKRVFGFTLVEMLVVIAVIVVLAGIVLPVVMRTQVLARGTSCANNLNQIGKGLIMYATNNERYFPCNRLFLPKRTRDPVLEMRTDRGFDSLSALYGVPTVVVRKTSSGEPETLTLRTTTYVPEIRVFNCPSTRDRCGKVEKENWWKEIRLKRTGMQLVGQRDTVFQSFKWQYVPPEPPKPQLSFEYCGEFNPSLQYSRINSRLAWLAHDEDARNENATTFQSTRDSNGRFVRLDLLQLYEKSNHRTRGGNVLFIDGRVEWVTAINWPQTIARGIEEWERVTGWRLPDNCYAPDPEEPEE